MKYAKSLTNTPTPLHHPCTAQLVHHPSPAPAEKYTLELHYTAAIFCSYILALWFFLQFGTLDLAVRHRAT